MVLAKITIKHEHSSGVRGVAAYHGSVCAVYSVRVYCAVRYVDWLWFESREVCYRSQLKEGVCVVDLFLNYFN